MDEAPVKRSLTWIFMSTIAAAVIAAGAARGLDAWHGVLAILGTALQIGALAYATRSAWGPRLRSMAKTLRARVLRHVFRRLSIPADAGTATAVGLPSGKSRRGMNWPKNDEPAQITELMRWVEILVGDVDALRDRVADVETGSVSALATHAAELEKKVNRQFRLTNEEAFVAGVLAVLGAVLTLIAEFVT